MKRFVCIVTVLAVFAAMGTAATYYVDPATGNDGAAGTSAAPWKTINKAKTAAGAGDTVYLRPGSYGSVQFASSSSGSSSGGHITYKGDPATVSPRPSDWYRKSFTAQGSSQRPVFGSISLAAGAHHITLEDLDITGGGGIHGQNIINNVTIRRVNIIGIWGATAQEVSPAYAIQFKKDYGAPVAEFKDIVVEECFIGTILRGIQISHISGPVTFRKNHITHLASSAIYSLVQTGGPYIVEGNHIHNYVVLHESPTIPKNTHMSGISIGNAGNGTDQRVEIRGNIIHSCGNTGPISMYSCGHDYTGYFTNILIENNLVYDSHSTYTVRLQCGQGPNCIVRNNTFVGKIYTGKENTYLRYSTLMMGNYPFHNNIVVGSSGGSGTQATGNVVFHSKSLDTSTNKVFYSGSGTIPMIFEQSGAFFVGSSNYTLAANHGRDLTDAFKLAAGSAAIDYGTASQAPATDILGNTRDASPDAGAYEYTTSAIHTQTPNPKFQIPIFGKQLQHGMYDLNGKKVREDRAGSGIYFCLDRCGNPVSAKLLIK